MSTGGQSLMPAVRATPKCKEVKVPKERLAGWHRVYYRAYQVERCLRPEHFKVGLRLAVLENRSQFTDKIPEETFYVGTVKRIWGNPDDPLVDIVYDGHPWSLGITFGIKQYHLMCIPLPVERVVKSPPKRTRAKTSKGTGSK